MPVIPVAAWLAFFRELAAIEKPFKPRRGCAATQSQDQSEQDADDTISGYREAAWGRLRDSDALRAGAFLTHLLAFWLLLRPAPAQVRSAGTAVPLAATE
jgi:hypothetical protein